MAETTGGDVITTPAQTETSRLSDLAKAQLEYRRAADLRQELAQQALREVLVRYSLAAAKVERTSTQASETLKELYASFSNELEVALAQHDPETLVTILDRYADLIVALSQIVVAPTRPEYAETVEQAQAAAEQLRNNARALQDQLGSITSIHIPPQGQNTDPFQVLAPVLAIELRDDGELLTLNLCNDLIARH